MTRIPERTLWQDRPTVGAIGLSCLGMSSAHSPAQRDDEQSVALIRTALETSVTLVDASDVFGSCHNETLVGRALLPAPGGGRS